MYGLQCDLVYTISFDVYKILYWVKLWDCVVDLMLHFELLTYWVQFVAFILWDLLCALIMVWVWEYA